MSTHNRCTCGEIMKIFIWITLLSRAIWLDCENWPITLAVIVYKQGNVGFPT